MKNRRDFLKEVCPTVAFAFFGISFLEACSSGYDDDVETTNPGNGTGTGSGTGGGTNTNGFTKNGNMYTIDITHSNFTSPPSNMGTGLGSVGGWMNGNSIGIPALFLRISEATIQAYSNTCPWHGLKTEWVLESTSTFRCNHQQNRFNTECTNSGSTSPVNGKSLKCYSPTLDGSTLNLTIS